MSNQVKGGRKPLSQKRKSAVINPDEIFNNTLNIPADVKAHAEKEGWELRFVDAQEMFRNGGQHKRGWMPYKRPKELAADDHGFKFGNDPEGVVRRTSLILAYRPVAQGDKHRAYNKQQADRMAGAFRVKEEGRLRQEARESGLPVEILSGYDDNE